MTLNLRSYILSENQGCCGFSNFVFSRFRVSHDISGFGSERVLVFSIASCIAMTCAS
jgi:hypothetical protein